MERRAIRRGACVVLAAAAVMIGCGGPDTDKICQAKENCAGGNDKDVQACVANADYEADLASEIGCGDEYDAFYECVETRASCKDKTYDVRGDDCKVEKTTYGRCANIN